VARRPKPIDADQCQPSTTERAAAGAISAGAGLQPPRSTPKATIAVGRKQQPKAAAAAGAGGRQKGGVGKEGDLLLRELIKATVTVAAGDDDSDVPDL
jgi:hypothetical protein